MELFIATPAMEQVYTEFFQSFRGLKFGDITTKQGCSRSSLVYDARNALAATALQYGSDRILWLDSDMVFDSDIILRLSADMDEGRRFVSGLYFKRKNPIGPVIYKATGYTQDGDRYTPYATEYSDYPKDDIFRIAGCGFGICMMDTQLLQEVYDRYGAPFAPVPGFGEDLSFCRRLEEMGVEMWCDSRIKAGHIAQTIVTEESYLNGVTL